MLVHLDVTDAARSLLDAHARDRRAASRARQCLPRRLRRRQGLAGDSVEVLRRLPEPLPQMVDVPAQPLLERDPGAPIREQRLDPSAKRRRVGARRVSSDPFGLVIGRKIWHGEAIAKV